jgi:3-phytase
MPWQAGLSAELLHCSVHLRARWVGLVALAVVVGTGLRPAPGLAQAQPISFLGEYDIAPKSLDVQDTTVGGLSGLTYDAKRDVYYVISDDRGEFGPARFYTVKLDIAADGLHDVQFVAMTPLDSDAEMPGIQPYAPGDSDTEDIVLLPDDTLVISSERDRTNQPWLRHFALDGSLLGEIPLPALFVPATGPDAQGRTVQTRGVRPNLAFEGLAWAPEEQALYAINEESLAQDGPLARTATGTQDRLLRFDWNDGHPAAGRQAVYLTEPIFAASVPADRPGDNGVSALMWARGVLPHFDFVAMERAFATGVGNDVNLYGVRTAGADDVQGIEALHAGYTGRMVDKTLLVNMASIGVSADNLEGLALGPRLADGGTALIVISDDNFNDGQVGQFLLFEIGPPASN